MKNEINAVFTNMTATIPEPEDYTGRGRAYLYCGKCHTPKEAYFAEERLVSGVTATRQSATASEQPARNGKPPKAGADTLKKWKN